MQKRKGNIDKKISHLPDKSLLEPFAATFFFNNTSTDHKYETCSKILK